MKKSAILFFLLLATIFAFAQNHSLLIGTYTSTGKSEGIYSYSFNSLTGESKLKNIAKNIINPSYLTLDPSRKFVYSVNETGKTSTVSTFKYDSVSNRLDFLNKVNSQGADPCYIIADQQNVIVANYSGGTLAVFQRKEDGSLSEAKQIIKHNGKGADTKGRQESAHVHMVQFTPDHKYLVCTDLGEDNIYIYHYTPNGKDTVLTLKSVFKTNSGTGPRHLTFSANGKFAYLVHEFNGSISVFSYLNGDLRKIQEIESMPKSFSGKIDGAAIQTSADGKFLYESNRGDANNITVFSIAENGLLKLVEQVSTLGRGPRAFTIDPSGNFILVAHQYTNDVVVFKRNKKSGKLADSGQRIEIGIPVCLIFGK